MLAAMVEQAQGKTTFVDEFEVDLCIVQTKDKEIVIWLSKVGFIYLLHVKCSLYRMRYNRLFST